MTLLWNVSPKDKGGSLILTHALHDYAVQYLALPLLEMRCSLRRNQMQGRGLCFSSLYRKPDMKGKLQQQ